VDGNLSPARLKKLDAATADFSAAAFASLRAELVAKARMGNGRLSFEQVHEIMADQIPPAIADTRRYQTLQALINCTRRSLLPNPNVSETERGSWSAELRELERRGIH